MEVTLNVPGEFASQLTTVPPEDLAEILTLGIREWQSRRGAQFTGLTGLLERLAELPEPRDVLNLRPSAELAVRASELLEKSRQGALSAAEETEFQQLEFAEHLVRIAKAQAALKLHRS